MQQRIHFLFSYVIAAFGQPKGAVHAAPYNQIGENENGINCNDPTAKAEQFGFGIPGRQNRFHKRCHRGPPSARHSCSCHRSERPPHARAPHAGRMTCPGRSPGLRVIILARLPGLCLKSPVAYRRRTHRLQLRAQLRIWPATKANRTEFPLLINVTNIPNASTANQPAFLVKAQKRPSQPCFREVGAPLKISYIGR
jgi:hypothetical protein